MEEKVIIKIPDELNRGESFIKVPSNLLRLSHISDGAKVTYMLLLDYSWQKSYCFPSQSTLANLKGVSIKTIYNHLNELRKNNFITWSQNGFKKPNTYFLNEVEYLSTDKQNISSNDLQKTTTNDKKDSSNKEDNINNTNSKKTLTSNVSQKEIAIQQETTTQLINGFNPYLYSLIEDLEGVNDLEQFRFIQTHLEKGALSAIRIGYFFNQAKNSASPISHFLNLINKFINASKA